jgi:hypothetical protein
MRYDRRTPRDVILEQIEPACMWNMLRSRNRYEPGQVGYLVRRLPEHDRVLLQNLKSEDIQNVRLPPWINNPSKLNIKVFHLPHTKL